MDPETGPAASAISGEWECMECGYIEEGAKASRPLKCPDCGAPAQALEFFPYGDDDDDSSDDELAGKPYDEDEDNDLLADDDDERSGSEFPQGIRFSG